MRTSGVAGGGRGVLVVACGILLGLLSMHGTGAHAESPVPPVSTVGTTVLGGAAPLEHAASGDGHAGHGAASDAGCATPCVDHTSGTVCLCLMLLGGLVLGFAAMLARRRVTLLPRTWLAAWARPVLLSRDREPPDLLRLGVLRC